MMVHLIDGTYELFRHFYGLRRFNKGKDRPFGAVNGVLHTVLQMIEDGATHIGVATDHVIESFRNELWPGYKTGEGIEPRAARAVPSARAGARRHGGRRVADGRARGRRCARVGGTSRGCRRARGESVHLDAGQGSRAMRARRSRRAGGPARRRRSATRRPCAKSSASTPALIPDYLALVGDSADGYPGIAGIGAMGAARLVNRYGPIEAFPPEVLGANREAALLFKDLATLRTNAELFDDVDSLAWRGPTDAFPECVRQLEDARLLERSRKAAAAVA